MSQSPDKTASDGRPPLGSWVRFYVLVCAAAVAYIVLLYWFTATFNHPGGAA